jgi:eukaryotic-like serine/threonine-protein kinase
MSEQAVFVNALEYAGPDRAAYLDQACAGDEKMRRQVEELLTAHERSGEFLDAPAVAQIAAQTPSAQQNTRTFAADANSTPGDRTAVHGDSPAAGHLGFLNPPTRPGSIGRLDHYEILERIGVGGFGTVFRAFDDRLHRIIAIKVLAPAYAANGSARRRFIREARTAASVKNEHIVGIYDVKEDAQPPYLAMEMIDGISLQEKIDKTGPLGVREILRIGMQAAEGLAAAHKQGLVHRDIKPANILLENGVERVKITDFGLARAVDDASVTQSGTVAGTPMYMSPEQISNFSNVTHLTDLYALGVCAYELFTGKVPFFHAELVPLLMMHVNEPPPPPRARNPQLPAELEGVILKLLAKDPAQRYQSCRELAQALGAIRDRYA